MKKLKKIINGENAQFSVTNTTNTNINNLSETGQFYVTDTISNYASNEVKKDNLISSSVKIGAIKFK